MARRKKIRKVIPDLISIITPPPYVEGQSIKIGVRRGRLYPVPMAAVVTDVGESSISLAFGGGKTETLQLRPDGTAPESELSKPEKKKKAAESR